MEEQTIKITVSGQVQMVGYRWYAKRQADMLGIRGYVRNLPHGEVQIVACGDKNSLETLMDYLRTGPSRARVDTLKYEPFDNDISLKDFQIRV